MKKIINDFSYYVTRYFTIHLPQERNFSENTIASYRDVFKGLIVFFKTEKGIKPDSIRIEMLTVEYLQDYLNYLNNKGNSISTQNQRLAVIKGFMKYLQLSESKPPVERVVCTAPIRGNYRLNPCSRGVEV